MLGVQDVIPTRLLAAFTPSELQVTCYAILLLLFFNFVVVVCCLLPCLSCRRWRRAARKYPLLIFARTASTTVQRPSRTGRVWTGSLSVCRRWMKACSHASWSLCPGAPRRHLAVLPTCSRPSDLFLQTVSMPCWSERRKEGRKRKKMRMGEMRGIKMRGMNEM